jgi:PleD family two-component response regulator
MPRAQRARCLAAGADQSWEELVRRADAALYAAKASGRNRVVTDPLPS